MDNLEQRKELFGFILHNLQKLGEKRYYGTLVTQKLIYFLKESFHVDLLPYRFRFYHYGPYSEELDFDLKLMKGYGTIDIGSDPQGKGYSITVIDEKAKEYISSAKGVIKKYNKESEELLRFFGTYTPKSFELLATIHYVYKKMKDSLTGAKLKEEVVNRVSELKSSFSKDDISTQYDLLVKEGLLK